MTSLKTVLLAPCFFCSLQSLLACGSDTGRPPPLTEGSNDSGVADGKAASDSEGGAASDAATADADAASARTDASSCNGCPAPTCSIDCIPHDVSVGGSTTYYWSSNGTTCSLSCPGLNVQMSVPCMGQDSSHFQNLQQSETCTFTATGPGGTVSCSDTVFVQ
jgi:hypothetical protein